jgi:aryl-alcohol dehydrogenase-like predicted oxidoreductase
VNRIALGSAQFGSHYGVANRSAPILGGEARDILAMARATGVDTLDTAVQYPHSEATLGEVGVDSWKVVTKLPPLPVDVGDVRSWVSTTLEGSLARLRSTSIYGLLVHRPSDLFGPRGTDLCGALIGLRETGRVLKIGASIYDPQELELVMRTLACDLVQAPLNVLDRRLVTTGWLERLVGEGVEVHTRSAFLQGVLVMPATSRPARFARWREPLSRWDDWVRAESLAPAHACLAFVLSHSLVNRVVVGVDNKDQLKQLLAWGSESTALAPASLASGEADLINPSRWSEP